ncbi:MAG: M28 family peptidase [Myxococcota bacterium]
MRELVEELASEACAGRAPGTAGGRRARALVVDALRDAGLDPDEQPIPKIGGANVLATLPGRDVDRWILVAAHYDHLGQEPDGTIYAGADDNAAAVSVLVETARRLTATRPDGRGVIFASFDAEEPPHFLSPQMGSEFWLRHPTVDPDAIDLAIVMDLVGHDLGGERLPTEVRKSLLCLGAERSEGTAESLAELAPEPGLHVRPMDAEIVPPLSDHHGFWKRERPFLFLTGGRSARYHTAADVAEHVPSDRLEATASWLERVVRTQCARDEAPFAFRRGRHDVSTLDTLADVLEALAPLSDDAAMGLALTRQLRGRVDRSGRLGDRAYGELKQLVEMVETGLEG